MGTHNLLRRGYVLGFLSTFFYCKWAQDAHNSLFLNTVRNRVTLDVFTHLSSLLKVSEKRKTGIFLLQKKKQIFEISYSLFWPAPSTLLSTPLNANISDITTSIINHVL